MVDGHNLPEDRSGDGLPDGGDGLVQSADIVVVAGHGRGRGMVRGGVGGSVERRGDARDFQHGSGLPVHERGVSRTAESDRRRPDQHGRQGARVRQHSHGKVLADGEVRGGFLAGVR